MNDLPLRNRDRLRLRMAAVVGPVGPAPLGFSGNTVVLCSRLLDSTALRCAVSRHADADVAVMVSEQLYLYVVGEGHTGFDAQEFRAVRVRSKHLNVRAWLWVNRGRRRTGAWPGLRTRWVREFRPRSRQLNRRS